MAEIELKRCPFCGAKDELEIWDMGGDEGSKTKGLWVVHCANCGCSMDWLDSKEEAIEAWNRRADNNQEAKQFSEKIARIIEFGKVEALSR